MKRVLLLLLLGLSACSSLSRDPRSGYSDDDGISYRAKDFYDEKRQYEEEQAREDLGWNGSRALSESERNQLDSRLRLRRLESKLESNRERKQYFALKGLMRSDGERIAFLHLPSVEARERWARNRGYSGTDEVHTDEIASLIEKNDISIGMSQKAVNESWGDPDMIEVAGDPVYGNERWRYSRYNAGNEGYQKQNRVVYFEAGRVVGWESE